jgi:copper chaperone CopZ
VNHDLRYGVATTTYAVTGMTCEHCVHAVTRELSELDGVSEAASR